MRIALPLALLLAVVSYVACGFGIYADDGSVNPSPGYWGWVCADGTTPDPDAGCLPQTCDNSSTPVLEADGGLECLCADQTLVLVSTCTSDTGGGDGGSDDGGVDDGGMDDGGS